MASTNKNDKINYIINSTLGGIKDAFWGLEQDFKFFMSIFGPIFWVFFPFFAIMGLVNFLYYNH